MSVTVNQISQAVGGGIVNGKVYLVRDIWGHKDLGEWTAGTYTTPTQVPRHDVFMIRLAPKPEPVPVIPVASTTGKEKIQFDIGKNILVSGVNGQPVSVTVFDLKGAAVTAMHNFKDGKCSINTASLPRGIYYAKVISGRESVVHKIILR
jgi:hypothetical protein